MAGWCSVACSSLPHWELWPRIGPGQRAPVLFLFGAAFQRQRQILRCAGAALCGSGATSRRPNSCDAQVPPFSCNNAMRTAAAMLLRAAQILRGAGATSQRQRQIPRCAGAALCGSGATSRRSNPAMRRCRFQRRRHYHAPPESCDAQAPPFSGYDATARRSNPAMHRCRLQRRPCYYAPPKTPAMRRRRLQRLRRCQAPPESGNNHTVRQPVSDVLNSQAIILSK